MSSDSSQKLRHRNICDLIRGHDHAYYVEARPIVSDQEYDALMLELKELEAQFPELQTPESPSQRVSGVPQVEFKKVTRVEKMLSLDNTYRAEEASAFLTKAMVELEVSALDTIIEPKVDGLSIECIYEKGVFKQASTRGDGLVGEDVTMNIRTLRSLPKKLSGLVPDFLTLRGEVYMTHQNFEALNKQREDEGLPLFKNPRNAAAGSVRLLDAGETAKRALHVLFYQCLEIKNATQLAVIESLKKWGLPTHDAFSKIGHPSELNDVIKLWGQKRLALPFETDGLVLKINSMEQQSQLGFTSKFPKWAVAYKFEAEKAETILKNIRIQIGRTGALTPVAELEPVELAGTTVSNASLHNFEEIERKDLRIGDHVIVQKAGEIIPQILRSLPEKRKGHETQIKVPEKCPECGNAVGKDNAEDVGLKCLNGFNCVAQLKEYLRYFVARPNFNMDGVGPSLLDQLVEKGFVKQSADLFSLKMDQIMSLDRMAEKSAQNVVVAIEKAKSEITLPRLISSLGISNVGVVAAKSIADAIQHISYLLDTSDEQIQAKLEEISGIGPTMIESILMYLKDEKNKLNLKKLIALGINPIQKTEAKQGPLVGKAICITGTLSKPRSEFQNLIVTLGGEVHNTATKKTSYLLVGADVGENKIKAAQKNKVTVISESEFQALIETPY